MKILAVFDDKPASMQALEAALALAERTRAAMGVVAVRSMTHATEETPPVGVDIPVAERRSLPVGIQALLGAADRMVAAGFLSPFTTVKLRDMPYGHLFYLLRTAPLTICKDPMRDPFCISDNTRFSYRTDN